MNLIRVHSLLSAVSAVVISFFGTTQLALAAINQNSEVNTSTLSLAQKLCENYSQIKTISCEIRKTTKGDGQSMRMISRVHYKSPNQIHVDNISPSKRTIIADGKSLYYYDDKQPRGFSKPIDELSETWLAPLRNIPGTALEHLIPLKKIEEVVLPNTDEDLIQRGYTVKDIFVVLAADSQNRLHKVTFYKTPQMKMKTGEYVYLNQTEVIPNCWISSHHKATLYLPAEKIINETRHISNMSVNEEIPDQIFNHELFMKGVEFTSEFKNTYQ